MASIIKIVQQMKINPSGVRFEELKKVCEYYFGKARQSSGSHCIFKTPWSGNPRVNIQNNKGKAKLYQVKQVLLAIEKLEADHDSGNG
ncbi:MAG: toxin HicA [Pseudomonadota bacterium]